MFIPRVRPGSVLDPTIVKQILTVFISIQYMYVRKKSVSLFMAGQNECTLKYLLENHAMQVRNSGLNL